MLCYFLYKIRTTSDTTHHEVAQKEGERISSNSKKMLNWNFYIVNKAIKMQKIKLKIHHLLTRVRH